MAAKVLSSKSKGKGKAVGLSSTLSSASSPHPDSAISSAEASDSRSASSDSSDSDLEEITPEYLESLLEKAKVNMEGRLSKDVSGGEQPEEEELRLSNNDIQDDLELPPLDPGALPPAYITFGKSRQDKPLAVRDLDAERAEKASGSLKAPAAPIPAREFTEKGKQLTKKEKAALKNKTAGSDWFDLPAPDPADLPRLYREVEALRLRNAMDPKRFYKKEEGEGKGIKGLPRHFAIGTMVPTSMPFGTASSDNLTRAKRKRTIVDELVDDAEAKRYAKKKFEDLQAVRRANGRGTFAKNKALRRPKW